ncbi:MAG: hypothetical protein ACYTGK_07220, partial [Planctomycetota bacterium]
MRSVALGGVFVACFVLTGSLLAVATHQILTGHESQRAAAQFDEHLAERSFALELEVNAVLEALHSLRALYDASEEVTREEFATFVRVALSRHSSIQAME